MSSSITNIVIAGIGGQGVLKASDICAEAAFRSGHDVKKAEIHGMSQRGGSVTSDIRFGEQVLSPMVPDGEADYLVVFQDDQVDHSKHKLSKNGTLISPENTDLSEVRPKKVLNVAFLGALSSCLDIPVDAWQEAMKANLPERFHDMNIQAFSIGRNINEGK